jgi:hypothetical protein
MLSIGLYVLSAFCYSYEAVTEGITSVYYPYQDCAFQLIAVASVLLLIAAIAYSKKAEIV